MNFIIAMVATALAEPLTALFALLVATIAVAAIDLLVARYRRQKGE